MDWKALVKQHILTICAALSLLALALPFISVKMEVEVMGMASGSESVTSGFGTLGKSVFAFLLILGPALIIVMNYIKPLEKFKGIIAVAAPLACIADLILVFFSVKSASASASGAGGSVEVSASLGIGALLALVSYVATVIAGAVTYHNFTLDKAGLEMLKERGKGLVQKTKDGASSVTAKFSSEKETSPAGTEGASASAAPVKRAPTNLSRTDEVLKLIGRLKEMKDQGILSEEEFAEKKKQLLSEI